jgi:hypothetical protein
VDLEHGFFTAVFVTMPVMKSKLSLTSVACNVRKSPQSFSTNKADTLIPSTIATATPSQAALGWNLNPTFGRSDFVWGANYVPARRMTTYQVWWRFDPDQIDREMGYAERIHLNALRMWLSYEYWQENPKGIEADFDKLLQIADKHKIKILISLFSCCGRVNPTMDRLRDESPVTGVETVSPGFPVTDDRERWQETYGYLDWFIGRYKNDSRLLAIEVINEPVDENSNAFALVILKRAAMMRGTVPLTIGYSEFPTPNAILNGDLDIVQTHPNFVADEAEAEGVCRQIQQQMGQYQKPMWVTEWQRIRHSRLGWGYQLPVRKERLPCHAPYCEIFKKNNIQGFFWSLMFRPSFLRVHDRLRWFNGIFHEDGSVWSLEDARAIANDPNLQITEKRELPEWAKDVDWDSDCKNQETAQQPEGKQ